MANVAGGPVITGYEVSEATMDEFNLAGMEVSFLPIEAFSVEEVGFTPVKNDAPTEDWNWAQSTM